ncbi:MAG: hypothetical protein QM750_05805 [Rubrivivax sp.]
MALLIRLDPLLEFHLERVLKDPAALLDLLRRAGPMGRPQASARTGRGLKARLRAKRSA